MTLACVELRAGDCGAPSPSDGDRRVRGTAGSGRREASLGRVASSWEIRGVLAQADTGRR